VLKNHTNICLHIGYHKTGSTTLQLRGFSLVDGLHLLSNSFMEFERAWHREMVEAGDFVYDKCGVINLIANGIAREPGRKAYVISDECMSGHVYSGVNARRNAIRLAEVMPNAKIFFVIRNQTSYIRSAYANYIYEGGSQRFKFWIEDYEYPVKSIFVKLQYHHLIKLYQELFGKANVLVLPFEMLKEEKMSGLLNAFCDFMDLPRLSDQSADLLNASRMNPSFSQNTTSILRIINGFRGGCTLNQRRCAKVLDKMIPRSAWNIDIYKHFDQKAAADHFKMSNVETSRLIGSDLSVYGYPV
jgi:hypothetical protein